MVRISQLGMDIGQSMDFILDARHNFDVSVLTGIHAPHFRSCVSSLREEHAKLQDSRKTLNPFRNYKAVKSFDAASRALYIQTRVRLPNSRFATFTQCTPV